MRSKHVISAALVASLAAGGVFAHSLKSSVDADNPVATIPDKPPRPSPIRPAITLDLLATILPPDDIGDIANGG